LGKKKGTRVLKTRAEQMKTTSFDPRGELMVTEIPYAALGLGNLTFSKKHRPKESGRGKRKDRTKKGRPTAWEGGMGRKRKTQA